MFGKSRCPLSVRSLQELFMRKLYAMLVLIFSFGYLTGIVCAETEGFLTDSENPEKPSLTDDLPMVREEMIQVLIDNLENLFPISSQRQIFVNPEEAEDRSGEMMSSGQFDREVMEYELAQGLI